MYDEIWISPHFEFSKEYLKIRYQTEHVYICPYIWRDDVIAPIRDRVLTIKAAQLGVPQAQRPNGLRVAILEPNLEQAKNCLVPLAICEKARHYIQKISMWNTVDIKGKNFPRLCDKFECI